MNETIPVVDLALGDVITRDPAGLPVHWVLASDPTTSHTHARFSAHHGDQLVHHTYLRGADVTVRAPAVRANTLIGTRS